MDAYRSNDTTFAHRFLILLYRPDGKITSEVIEANCYADAIEKVAPGNDLIKVEILAL